RDDAHARAEDLEEGELHLERVLPAVRLRVLLERRAEREETLGETAVDGHVAERLSPGGGRIEGEWRAAAGVVRTEDDRRGRDRDRRVHGSGDRARIDVSGVRHDRAERRGWRPRGFGGGIANRRFRRQRRAEIFA